MPPETLDDQNERRAYTYGRDLAKTLGSGIESLGLPPPAWSCPSQPGTGRQSVGEHLVHRVDEANHEALAEFLR
jgi:hypothetical protein